MEEFNQISLFPEMESSSKEIKLFSDSCCDGCICTSDKDHQFVMEEIDFDQ